MQSIDLNLLEALDALLTEGSVTAAAARMNLSVPAVSRALSRLRRTIGDPILVRAGHGLVPTPRALALRCQVRAVLDQARALLQPEQVSPATLQRTFTVRTNEATIGVFAAALAEAVRAEAPGVVLRFAPEGDEDVAALRDGLVDLDIDVLGETGPEVKAQLLLRDRIVGVVRAGHPLAAGPVTAEAFAAFPHISVSRRGRLRGPIDEALATLGLARAVPLVVPSAPGALLAVAASDLVAAMPSLVARRAMARGLAVAIFDLPVDTGAIAVSLVWHPRFDADPAHRWLRDTVRRLIRDGLREPE